jgi:hypothetical protein
MRKIILLLLLLLPYYMYGQVNQSSASDSLKLEILNMKADVDNIKLNLGRVENRFKTGIFVSTLGYSIVITGGLMLGRKNDELGKVLLVAGGATGVTGTILMVDAFKFLGIASGKKKKSR